MDAGGPSKFVAEAAIAVFGEKVLKISTISGSTSNRNKNKKALDKSKKTSDLLKDSPEFEAGASEENDEEKHEHQEVLKLDSTKIAACKGKVIFIIFSNAMMFLL